MDDVDARRAGAEERSRVLLFDGVDRSRELLRDGLLGQGFDVVAVFDELAAADALRRVPFDAVVLSLDYPSPERSVVLKEAVRRADETVVILLTNELDVASAVGAMRSGVFDILQQPVRCLELSTRLQEGLRAMEGGEGLSSWAPPAAPTSGRFRASTGRRVLGTSRLIGDSDGMKRVREQIENLARFRDVSVLIVGETGTGKEVVAAAIHDLTSPGEELVSVNCAAIPEQLFENELFGHASGAFTGSTGERSGLFEDAGEGTFFLDEVAEMPAGLQPKLLRVLQTRRFRRVGCHIERQLNARIVSATNRAVSASDQSGMRSDLYFRLAGLAIHLPPLRERISDVPLLARHFLANFAEKYPGVPGELAPSALKRLEAHLWPGNVRELQAVIEQAAMMCSGSELTMASVEKVFQERAAQSSQPPPPSWDALGAALEEDAWDPATLVSGTVEDTRVREIAIPGQEHHLVGLSEVEREITIRAYRQNGRNLSRTARALSIPRTTLRDRLKRYGEC